MSDLQDYHLIGAEESPYSVKVRSYLRYKSLPHQWLSRQEAADLYQKHAKLPLIPLLVSPDGPACRIPHPSSNPGGSPPGSIHPPGDPVCAFVSRLLEEFADEWGNKWMFHYRWAREADQIACSKRLAALMAPEAGDARSWRSPPGSANG